MTNIKLSFSMDDVVYSIKVQLDKEHLIILEHQEVLFEGTISGLVDIINNENVEHYNNTIFLRIYSNIVVIIRRFQRLLNQKRL